MMKANKQLLFLAVFLGSASVAHASFIPSDWLWERPITNMPEVAAPLTYIKVDLDPKLSIHSAPFLPDLRVVSNNGEEVPFQLLTEETEATQSAYTPQIISHIDQQGYSVYLLDLGKSGLRHNTTNIVVGASANYRRQVSVYASDVLLKWDDPKWGWIDQSSSVSASGQSAESFIYDFTDNELNFHARSGSMHYPDTAARYMRVVIHRDGTIKNDKTPVLLDVVRFDMRREVKPTAAENHIDVPATITQDGNAKTTILTADLGGGGLDGHAVTLSVGNNDNFNRRSVVMGSTNGVDWSLIQQGYFFQINTPLLKETQLSINYPVSAFRYLRVIIYNDDDTAIALLPSMRIWTPLRSVVFAAKPAALYSLYYGNPSAQTPKYDLARFFQFIDSADLPHAVLGVEAANPAYAAPLPPKKPVSEQYPELLNGILILLVALVTFFLISYLKRLKLSDRGPDNKK